MVPGTEDWSGCPRLYAAKLGLSWCLLMAVAGSVHLWGLGPAQARTSHAQGKNRAAWEVSSPKLKAKSPSELDWGCPRLKQRRPAQPCNSPSLSPPIALLSHISTTPGAALLMASTPWARQKGCSPSLEPCPSSLSPFLGTELPARVNLAMISSAASH